MRPINSKILVSILAARFGIDRSLVELAARRLREHGMFPVGKRGHGGAQLVTTTDAARLVVAIAASESMARAPEYLAAYEDLAMSNWSRDSYLAGGQVNSQYSAPEDLADLGLTAFAIESVTANVVSAIATQINDIAGYASRDLAFSQLPAWTIMRSKTAPGAFFTLRLSDEATINFAYMRSDVFYDALNGPPVAAMPIPAMVLQEVGEAFAHSSQGGDPVEPDPIPVSGDDPSKVA